MRDQQYKDFSRNLADPGWCWRRWRSLPRRRELDAAGVDKQRPAPYVDCPAQLGQAQYAITRGNSFEAQVKANGYAELLRLLREQLGLTIPEVSYDDLEHVGDNRSPAVRHVRTRNLLARAAASRPDAGTLF